MLVIGCGGGVIGAFVLVPAAQEDTPIRTGQPAAVLAAQALPLMEQPPVAALQQFGGLLNQQVVFHVDLAVDFVVTGAQLIGRQIPVPGTLVQDIQNGTPLPVAVSRALQTLVEVELDAGRELVGFAAEYVDFQVRFVANVVQTVVVIATAVPAAVGELVTSTIAGLTSSPDPAPDDVFTSREVNVAASSRLSAETAVGVSDNPADTEAEAEYHAVAPKKRKPAVTATTLRAQGEVRSKDSTDITDVDDTESTSQGEGDATGKPEADVAEESAGPSGDDSKPGDDTQQTDDRASGESTQGNVAD